MTFITFGLGMLTGVILTLWWVWRFDRVESAMEQRRREAHPLPETQDEELIKQRMRNGQRL